MALKILENGEINYVCNLWRTNRKQIITTYGHISDWDTSCLTCMSRLFLHNIDFNEDIGRWNVSNVTNMSHMFSGAARFNQDISHWNVSKVYDMSCMFSGVI
jgi:surface protein